MHPHARNASPRLLLLAAAAIFAFAATTNAQQGMITGVPPIDSITAPLGARPTTTNNRKPTGQPAATTTSSSSGGILSGAPTLYGVGVPPLIVPDTSDAPFMQKSSLPAGTVFICVGAALGFLGMSVLAWRGLVAWSLHRSVRRAARTKYASEKKSAYGGAPPTQYSKMYHSSNPSLDHLASANTAHNGAGGQGYGRTSKQPKNSSRGPSGSALFFSPTAGTGQAAANRTSSYLPAGFYASGASMPAAGSSIAQLGGPSAAGYGRVDAHANSPPPSPGHARQDSHDRPRHHHGRSGSSGRDLQHQKGDQRRSSGVRDGHRSSQQRAPSAVLDELFQHHTGMRERD